MHSSIGFAAICIAAIVSPPAMTAQTHCPVVGDTVTLTGFVSIVHSGELNLPDLYLMTFPNRSQPICTLVKPYFGAGIGRVDRIVANVARIWLVWPQQLHRGVVDWEHPVPIVTGKYIEITGKIIGQGDGGIDYSHVPFSEKTAITLEVINLNNVDAEVNGALHAWRDECNRWIKEQLATWSSKHGAHAEIVHRRHSDDVDPFATVNGAPAPKCVANIQISDANGARGARVVNDSRWASSNTDYVVPFSTATR